MKALLSPSDITDRTVYLERYRAICMGIFESYSAFLLVVLVRWFNGTPTDKSIIAASSQAGLLLSPLVLFTSRHLRWSAPRTLAALLALSSIAFLLASLVGTQTWFVVLTTLGIIIPATALPLQTSIFNNNYPATRRGQLFAQNQALRIGTSIGFGSLAGWFISGRLEMYPWILLAYALALACSAFLVSKVPGQNASTPRAPLFSCFKYLIHDSILRDTTISWTLLGLGNLMMVPLRVEYLANPLYGLSLSELDIALLVSVLPNIARLGGTYIWGRLFDSVNFFSLRMALNLSFALGIITFFTTSSWSGLALAAFIFGFSTSGGDVAWNLWVTKFAPADRVADYMTVHTFFTGVRGLIAPFAAFHLVGVLSIQGLSLVSGALIVAATVMLLPVRRRAGVDKSN